MFINERYCLIGIALDTGNSGVVPTITVSDADATSKKEHEEHDDTPAPVGAMPAGVAPAIPDWYKVGWRQVGGIDAEPLAAGEARELSVLQMFLGEQFYGEWYWNATLIVFVSFTRFIICAYLTYDLGRLCVAFHHSIWIWLGMVVCSPCSM